MVRRWENDPKAKDIALLALRIGLGVVFILHGYGKLFGNSPGMENFTKMVTGLGFPAPSMFAYIAALSEFLGGIAMLLGIFTDIFSVLLAIVMAVVLTGVKKFSFPKSDVEFALLLMNMTIFLMGPGRLSLRELVVRKMKKQPAPPAKPAV